jgi:hypothetical protein
MSAVIGCIAGFVFVGLGIAGPVAEFISDRGARGALKRIKDGIKLDDPDNVSVCTFAFSIIVGLSFSIYTGIVLVLGLVNLDDLMFPDDR